MKNIHFSMEGIASIAIALLAIAASYALGGVPPVDLLKAVVIAGVSAAIGSLVTIIYFRTELPARFFQTVQPVMARVEACLKNTIESVTNDAMAEIETSFKGKEIWITSPDLHKDYCEESHVINPIVRKNVAERGVTYVYILRDDGTVKEKARRIRKELGKISKNVKFVYLKQSDWITLPYISGDVIFYVGADRSDGSAGETAEHTYYEAPTDRRETWIKVNHRTGLQWSAMVRQFAAAELLSGREIPEGGESASS